MNIEKTIANLRKNRMQVLHVANRAEALEALKSLLPEGGTVTHGGCMTLSEIGGTELLKSGKYNYLDRSTASDPTEIYYKGYNADVFLTSANAITEDGELYNVDGNSNRISAICYGPKKVIVLAGINKIVPTLADAVTRVKTVAAPKNAARLHCPTYCAEAGKCVSLLKENPSMTDGCDSPGRICRNYLVSGPQLNPDRITVVLIDEELGY